MGWSGRWRAAFESTWWVTIEEVAGEYRAILRRWDGSAWVQAAMYRWDGATYTPVTMYVWSGVEWQLVKTS